MAYDSLVLPPYVRAKHSLHRRTSELLYLVAVLAFSATYGCLIAWYVQSAVAVCLALPALLTILVLWAAPATDRVPERLLEFLFFASLVALIIWPNYLALSFPGLPWITLNRLVQFPLLCVLLYCIFVSPMFRKQLLGSLGAAALIKYFFFLFIAMEVFSIAVSVNLDQSLNKFLIAQTSWTSVFLIGCYIFLKPGRASLWAGLIWITAVVVAIIGVLEHAHGKVLWVDHIPAFLKIQDPAVLGILTPHYRDYSDRYRAMSTFSTPLGFAEYLALALPFILHSMIASRRILVRICAAITIPLLAYAVLATDCRLGVVGFLLAFLLYSFFLGLLRWRRNRKDIFGLAIVLAFPVVIAGTFSLTFVSHRMHAMVWGSDASEQGSTEARLIQKESAFSKVEKRPWGYGMYMAAYVVGYRAPGSNTLTLDSYYLTILVEYGILGFAVFYGLFMIGIFIAGSRLVGMGQGDPEIDLLLPAMLSLVNFVVIKSVFSQDDNHPIVFMLLSMVVALTYRSMALGSRSRAVECSPLQNSRRVVAQAA